VSVQGKLTRDEECDRILESFGPRFDLINEALDQQFRTIHNRSQVLLGICGILISASVVVTTGRIVIGRPAFLHQHVAGILLNAAGVMDMLAAAIVVGGVLRVRWLTEQPGASLRAWVLSTLAYRDRKTRTYRASIVLLLLAMLSYQVAVAIALSQL
jgi:hypothetical protein